MSRRAKCSCCSVRSCAPTSVRPTRTRRVRRWPQSSAHAREAQEAAPRETALGWRERLAEALSVRSLRPAHVATLALLLIATALGLRWLAGSHTPDGTRQPEAHASANTNGQPVSDKTRQKIRRRSRRTLTPLTASPHYQAKTPEPPRPAGFTPRPRAGRENAQARREHRAQRRTREGLSQDTPQEAARVSAPTLQPPSPLHPLRTPSRPTRRGAYARRPTTRR